MLVEAREERMVEEGSRGQSHQEGGEPEKADESDEECGVLGPAQ